ncbi:MAG: PTS sugar transporter subunit IIA, partial [Neobacillus sp.]
MKITELLTKSTILLNVEGRKKEGAIDQLVDVLVNAKKITNRAEFKAAILKREEQS